MTDIPEIIKKNCLDFKWNNEDVWGIGAPVEKMSISDLNWQFDFPFWHSKEKKYIISPADVFGNNEKFGEQYKRIMDCDLEYPIEVMLNKKGSWEILDGLHRLAKAFLLGHKKVRVRKIPRSCIRSLNEKASKK